MCVVWGICGVDSVMCTFYTALVKPCVASYTPPPSDRHHGSLLRRGRFPRRPAFFSSKSWRDKSPARLPWSACSLGDVHVAPSQNRPWWRGLCGHQVRPFKNGRPGIRPQSIKVNCILSFFIDLLLFRPEEMLVYRSIGPSKTKHTARACRTPRRTTSHATNTGVCSVQHLPR